MNYRALASLLPLLLSLPVVPAAAAEEASGSVANETTPAGRRASKLAKRARALAEDGRYWEAIEDYEEAYRIGKAPLVLLDLANTHRLAGDCMSALRYYRRYLDADPWVKSRRTLELRARQMETCADTMPTSTREEDAAIPEAAPTPRLVTTYTEPPTTPGRASRIAGATGTALGVSLLAGAVYFHVKEHNAWARVDDLLEAGGMWSEHHAALEEEARQAHNYRNTLYVVGGLTAFGGAVLYYLGWREGQARVTLVPVAGGGGIHVRF